MHKGVYSTFVSSFWYFWLVHLITSFSHFTILSHFRFFVYTFSLKITLDRKKVSAIVPNMNREQEIKSFETWVRLEQAKDIARGNWLRHKMWNWAGGLRARGFETASHVVAGLASGIKTCCIRHFLHCSGIGQCGFDQRSGYEQSYHTCEKHSILPPYKIYWHDENTWSAAKPCLKRFPSRNYYSRGQS